MNVRRATLAALGTALLASCGSSAPSDDDACERRLPGDLVVSEFLVDPDGTDTGKEYIELFNATDAEIDLGGLTLYVATPAEKTLTLRAAKVPASGYFVLGDVRADPGPAYVDYPYGNRLGALRNSDGRIGLRCRDKLLDEVAYTTTRAGRARELDGALVPDFAVNDLETSWCDAATAIEGSTDFGTPGAPNSTCRMEVGATCMDAQTGAARPRVTPGPGDLVITEFLASPAAVSQPNGEWFEIYARKDLDLDGLTVRTASAATTLASPTCLRVRAGAFAILARNDNPAENGGLPPVTAKVTITLADSNGTLSIRRGDTVIDEVGWGSSRRGIAAQLDPAKISGAANDDPLTFCPATDVYGSGDKGTPGAANNACPLVAQPGQCFDQATGFPRDQMKPTPGDLVINEVMPDPGAVADTAGEWLELMATSPVDLNDLILSTGGTTTDPIASPSCLHLLTGQYAIVARSDDPAMNGGLPFVTWKLTLALANSNATVFLKNGSLTLDAFAWTKAKPGVALQRDPADAATICDATVAFGLTMADKGTPGATNGACLSVDGGGGMNTAGHCTDPETGLVRDIVKPRAGELVITEIMADPAAVADDVGEWFEVAVGADVDLNELTLGNEGTATSLVSAATCLRLPAGRHAIFARSLDPTENGGLPPVTARFTFALANSGTAAAPRAVTVSSDGVEIDRMTYISAVAGLSLQLSRDRLDAVSNDDGTAWCLTPARDALGQSTNQFGAGDHGTPAAANEICP